MTYIGLILVFNIKHTQAMLVIFNTILHFAGKMSNKCKMLFG